MNLNRPFKGIKKLNLKQLIQNSAFATLGALGLWSGYNFNSTGANASTKLVDGVVNNGLVQSDVFLGEQNSDLVAILSPGQNGYPPISDYEAHVQSTQREEFGVSNVDEGELTKQSAADILRATSGLVGGLENPTQTPLEFVNEAFADIEQTEPFYPGGNYDSQEIPGLVGYDPFDLVPDIGTRVGGNQADEAGELDEAGEFLADQSPNYSYEVGDNLNLGDLTSNSYSVPETSTRSIVLPQTNLSELPVVPYYESDNNSAVVVQKGVTINNVFDGYFSSFEGGDPASYPNLLAAPSTALEEGAITWSEYNGVVADNPTLNENIDVSGLLGVEQTPPRDVTAYEDTTSKGKILQALNNRIITPAEALQALNDLDSTEKDIFNEGTPSGVSPSYPISPSDTEEKTTETSSDEVKTEEAQTPKIKKINTSSISPVAPLVIKIDRSNEIPAFTPSTEFKVETGVREKIENKIDYDDVLSHISDFSHKYSSEFSHLNDGEFYYAKESASVLSSYNMLLIENRNLKELVRMVIKNNLPDGYNISNLTFIDLIPETPLNVTKDGISFSRSDIEIITFYYSLVDITLDSVDTKKINTFVRGNFEEKDKDEVVNNNFLSLGVGTLTASLLSLLSAGVIRLGRKSFNKSLRNQREDRFNNDFPVNIYYVNDPLESAITLKATPIGVESGDAETYVSSLALNGESNTPNKVLYKPSSKNLLALSPAKIDPEYPSDTEIKYTSDPIILNAQELASYKYKFSEVLKSNNGKPRVDRFRSLYTKIKTDWRVVKGRLSFDELDSGSISRYKNLLCYIRSINNKLNVPLKGVDDVEDFMILCQWLFEQSKGLSLEQRDRDLKAVKNQIIYGIEAFNKTPKHVGS